MIISSKKNRLILIIAILPLMVGCGTSGTPALTPTPNLDATIEAALEQTIEAQPPPTNTVMSSQYNEDKAYTISTNENGWQVFTYKDLGFSISLPPEWTHFDLSGDDFDKMLSLAEEVNPQLEELFSTEYIRNLAAAGIKLMAVDTSVESLGSGIASTMNILTAELSIEITFDDYVEINIRQLQNMFGQDLIVNNETIIIGKNRAEVLDYEVVLNDIYGQPQDVQIQQYLLLVDKMQYVLTFNSTKENFSESQKTFFDIAQSFDLVQ